MNDDKPTISRVVKQNENEITKFFEKKEKNNNNGKMI